MGIILPPERTKNGLMHVVPMSPQTAATLQEANVITGRDFVFGEGASGFQGWSKAKAAINSRINKRRISCGEKPIADWVLHDLRRSFVTHMNELKIAPPHIVEACVNHISGHKASVAGIYNRALYSEEKRAAFEAWGAFVADLVSK